MEQDEPGGVVPTEDGCGQGLAGGGRDLGGLGVADDRGARQDVAAVAHAHPGGLAGAERVVHGDEHDPRRDRPSKLGQRRVALRDALFGSLRRSAVVGAVTVERPDDAEHDDCRDRAERTGGEGREERIRPGSTAERRHDRAELRGVDPEPVHAVRRRAERSVVGPEGIVVVVVVMGVVALVARGPHRGECNDGPVQIDRDADRRSDRVPQRDGPGPRIGGLS